MTARVTSLLLLLLLKPQHPFCCRQRLTRRAAFWGSFATVFAASLVKYVKARARRSRAQAAAAAKAAARRGAMASEGGSSAALAAGAEEQPQ